MEVEMEDMGAIAARQQAESSGVVHGDQLRFKYAHTGFFSKNRFLTLIQSKSVATNRKGMCRNFKVSVFVDGKLTDMFIKFEIQYYNNHKESPIAYLMHIETKGHGYDDLKGVGALLVFAMAKEITSRHVSDMEVALPAADQRGFYAHMGFDTSVMGRGPGKTATVFQKSRTSAQSHWLPA
ncbi:hypothetical protein [Niveispirillum irakense]|uniref:hypothetical protein n=1 Tax=Niveispirillum irakense TaxID=34011 RepID=UPI00049088CF|nr:hypothetical protein [Niveispirillum irakense]